MKKKNLCTGPLGFPMTDSQAKALEKVLKTLPKDHTYRKLASVPESLELVDGERADVSLVSTDAVDAEGDVVLPGGVDLTIYRMNPIVQLSHRWDELPVGVCKWIKPVERGILAKTQYASRPEGWEGQWMPDAIFSLTQQGILKGKSIGFQPTRIRSATADEIKQNPTWEKARGVIESAILIEYSVAPIPCNQEALTVAVSKGLASAALLKRLGLELPKGKAQKPVNVTALLARALDRIKLDPDQAVQYAMNQLKNRGKV